MNKIPELISRYLPKTGGSLLDIGCGNKTYSDPFVDKHWVATVDAWTKVNPDFVINLEKDPLPFDDNTYGTTLMLDFIEHLEKDVGYKVLEEAKRVTRDHIIMLTPLAWSNNKHNVNNPSLWCYGNEYDIHKSLWTPEDFKDWERITENLFPGCNNYYIGVWNANNT